MGYSTSFEGILTVTPAFSDAEVASLNEFFYTDMRELPHPLTFPGPDGAHYPGYHCDLEASEQGLSWNGSEKSYYLTEWVQYIIEHRTELRGKTVNGTLIATGDEIGDAWELVVRDNEAWENVWAVTDERSEDD